MHIVRQIKYYSYEGNQSTSKNSFLDKNESKKKAAAKTAAA